MAPGAPAAPIAARHWRLLPPPLIPCSPLPLPAATAPPRAHPVQALAGDGASGVGGLLLGQLVHQLAACRASGTTPMSEDASMPARQGAWRGPALPYGRSLGARRLHQCSSSRPAPQTHQESAESSACCSARRSCGAGGKSDAAPSCQPRCFERGRERRPAAPFRRPNFPGARSPARSPFASSHGQPLEWTHRNCSRRSFQSLIMRPSTGRRQGRAGAVCPPACRHSRRRPLRAHRRCLPLASIALGQPAGLA